MPPTMSMPYTIFQDKDIFHFKNVFFCCFRIVFEWYLASDRDMDPYTVKRMPETWAGGDTWLKKKCMNREGVVCPWQNLEGRKAGEGIVGRDPERGWKVKKTTPFNCQIKSWPLHRTRQITGMYYTSTWLIGYQASARIQPLFPSIPAAYLLLELPGLQPVFLKTNVLHLLLHWNWPGTACLTWKIVFPAKDVAPAPMNNW